MHTLFRLVNPDDIHMEREYLKVARFQPSSPVTISGTYAILASDFILRRQKTIAVVPKQHYFASLQAVIDSMLEQIPSAEINVGEFNGHHVDCLRLRVIDHAGRIVPDFALVWFDATCIVTHASGECGEPYSIFIGSSDLTLRLLINIDCRWVEVYSELSRADDHRRLPRVNKTTSRLRAAGAAAGRPLKPF
ncbi:hypothetical protein EVAR_17514_1 [Eumeta japonica]|uniref:Uncharacterized protein n=1 Tax=Eumeta variegata TaxID=151549 RepID=A0A4C1WSY8_EUMVA|nr:hypothetical protein EVAR_17514_1 [Eumeta japonica]